MKRIKILDDIVELRYEGFDWIPGGGEDGYCIDDYAYPVEVGEVEDFLYDKGEEWDTKEEFKQLVEKYQEEILDYFLEESQKWAIDKYQYPDNDYYYIDKE